MTWSTPGDQKIKDILANRIDIEGDGVGLLVGIVDASGPRIVSHGSCEIDANRPLTGETVFEIGSNTKVFTALLLAEMAERGEVRLDEPVADVLPDDIILPERGGRPITLTELATHTSGLPRDADNYGAKSRANPFANYTVERLYDFLRRQRISPDAGKRPFYSNIGMGLLGHALAIRAGVDFETLMQKRIVGPLTMTSTAVTLTPKLQARLATGHDVDKRPVPSLDLPAIAGAGGLRSTADDLLAFLTAALGHVDTTLAAAMAAQLSVRIDARGGDFQSQALGWGISRDSGLEIAWHVGRTNRFRCFMGLAPKTGAGVVVLGNMATRRAGDDIGLNLLTGKPIAPLSRPVDVHLDAEALLAFAGRYQLTPEREIAVSVEHNRLVFDPPGRRYVFHAADDTSFYLKQFDVEVRFERHGDNRAGVMHICQNGRMSRAVRIY